MDFELTLKNYRCFPDSKPAQVRIVSGFTALLGVNNSGKSSLLKFFYEFRPLFELLSGDATAFQMALQRNPRSLGTMPSVADTSEVFCNQNSRDIEVGIRVLDSGPMRQSNSLPATGINVTVRRSDKLWVAEIPKSRVSLRSQHLQLGSAEPYA